MTIIGERNRCAASTPTICGRLSEVVAQGSFTRAAKRLNLAQPTISLQIRELETRLGVRLVDRMGKRAFATAAGRELIEHAQRISEETDQLLAAMRRHRDGWLGQVRIGSSTTALIYHLPPVLARLRKEHPNIELVVTTGTTTGVVERMLRNEIDLGIVSLPINERLHRSGAAEAASRWSPSSPSTPRTSPTKSRRNTCCSTP